jgi:hypothetical protein
MDRMPLGNSDAIGNMSDMKEQGIRKAGRRAGTRVRAAVKRSLTQTGNATSAYDVLKKAGLIGALKTGPRDLSTNRKRFDGFGA